MREIIVGTAGHIDHGKTALVEALTGINADRLKEEKLRGITIDLGFATLELPHGIMLGIVDVPGHERFVKTMVAGATGIDLVMLVVAADEGVMPQTREHLDICRLLRVPRGLIALTKVDLVDEEWLQLVEEDVREFTRGTFLEGAPLVRTSAVTGEGIAAAADALEALCVDLEDRPPARFFRLPIDRIFVMKGFGTVVTGTLMEGSISEGQGVEIAPRGIRSKVRGLQVHNRPVKEAAAGTRTAVNLQAVEKEELERGDVMIPQDSFVASHMADLYLEYLGTAPRPLKNRARVRFHTGTSEILGRVVLLDRDRVEPGEAVYAQIRLEAPTVTIHGDPFVIRSYSPIQTVGGGTVLDNLPRKHRRHEAAAVLQHLQNLHGGEPPSVVVALVAAVGVQGLTRGDLDRRLNWTDERWQDLYRDPHFVEAIKVIGGSSHLQSKDDQALFICKDTYEKLLADMVHQVKQFHSAQPLEPGIPKDSLRGRCRMRPPARVFSEALQDLLSRGEVLVDGDRWRWSGHRFDLGREQQRHLDGLVAVFQDAGLQPPALKTVGEALRLTEKEAKELAELLVRQGTLVKIKEGLYFPREEIEKLQSKVIEYLREQGEMQPADFRELTGLSRKFMIPLLEYFDRTKITMRVGEKRVLRS
jgi:selenocysteine-specific elongation factor